MDAVYRQYDERIIGLKCLITAHLCIILSMIESESTYTKVGFGLVLVDLRGPCPTIHLDIVY
jgi:hypothetical protein